MIITIKNESGDIIYDTAKITDDAKKNEANIIISKVGTVNIILESLNFAVQGYQNNLEAVLKECAEAVVEKVETPTEDGGATKEIPEEGMTEDDSSTEDDSLNEVS
tara:strand:+ start:3045 stop:3362 length:318 start_codon:yes stop_codon:yes gene_type:complete